MLHERDEWLIAKCQAIEQQIQTGLAELDRGDGIPEDELDAYLIRLKAQPDYVLAPEAAHDAPGHQAAFKIRSA